MRVATALALSPLAVLSWPAAALLWAVWHLNDRDATRILEQERQALHAARLTNMAMWNGKGLDEEERDLRQRIAKHTGIGEAETPPEMLAGMFTPPDEVTGG